ncbi:MAG TPA: ATP-binding protein, partial [Rhodospirillales bacterium]|nr:ATP-binding protein [Rhodospirillales bacterium]
ILDVSAIELGKLELHEENLDAGKIVGAAMHMVNSRAIEGNINLTGNADDGLPMLHADKRRLMQILLNLVSNAIKFTPSGGEASLTASLDGEDAHVFTVTDTGIGMDEEEQVKAMSKFGQVDSGLNRKQEGTGLGLPLTRELVELHGGTLEIESEKGKGTSVTVRFPPERTVAS